MHMTMLFPWRRKLKFAEATRVPPQGSSGGLSDTSHPTCIDYAMFQLRRIQPVQAKTFHNGSNRRQTNCGASVSHKPRLRAWWLHTDRVLLIGWALFRPT